MCHLDPLGSSGRAGGVLEKCNVIDADLGGFAIRGFGSAGAQLSVVMTPRTVGARLTELCKSPASFTLVAKHEASALFKTETRASLYEPRLPSEGGA